MRASCSCGTRSCRASGRRTTSSSTRTARLLAEAEGLEARARRRDLVVDDDVLFDFYDERVPDDVVSARHFDQWWKQARRTTPDLLSFTRELLVADGADAIDEQSFPSRWPQGDLSLPLTYQFQPGTEADGVTVHVPLVSLARLRPEGFDWLVPGLRAELVTATIRALPKPVRVQLVPAPDVAAAVDAWMDEHLASWEDTVRAGDAAPSFHDAFRQAVRAIRDVDVPEDAFDDTKLPAHLRMTFRVVGDRGGVVDDGKDLLLLQRQHAARAQDAVSSAVRTALRAAMEEATVDASTTAADSGRSGDGTSASAGSGPSVGARPVAPSSPPPPAAVERTVVTSWADVPGGTLPEVVETSGQGGVVVRAFPTLVEEGTSVALRALADEQRVAGAHRLGLRRLVLTETALASARITTRWTGTQALALAASPYPSTQALVADVQLAAVDRLMSAHLAGADATTVRDTETYAALRTAVRAGLEDAVHAVVTDLVAVLVAWREPRRAGARHEQPRAARHVAGRPRPVRRSGARRLRLRGRRGPSAAPGPLPARRRLPADEGRRQPGPGRRPGLAGAGVRRPARGGRREGPHGHAGPGAGRGSRRRAVDGRGAAGQPVRAAARHARADLADPDPQGPRLARLIRTGAARADAVRAPAACARPR